MGGFAFFLHVFYHVALTVALGAPFDMVLCFGLLVLRLIEIRFLRRKSFFMRVGIENSAVVVEKVFRYWLKCFFGFGI